MSTQDRLQQSPDAQTNEQSMHSTGHARDPATSAQEATLYM